MKSLRQAAQKGFTLLEVLIALIILAGGIIVISSAWSGNFMRIRKSALYYDAAALLERKMVEVEAKYKNKQLSEIPEAESGDFGSEQPAYRWEMKSRDLKLPDLSPLIMAQAGDQGADETLISMIKQVTEYLSQVIKEVKVSVFIKRGVKEVEFNAIQYFIDYNKDFGGIGGGAPAGGAAGGPQPSPTPGGGSR